MKSLLQTEEWIELKLAQGWQSFNAEGVSVLEKKLPFGKGFLYSPEVSWKKINNIDELIKKIQKIAEDNNDIFYRLEIVDEYDQKIVYILKKNGFVKSFEEVQPGWRQIVDISKSEAEILTQMKPKGRYNIRIAQKHNVKIEKSQNINDFYEIFCQTAKRDGFEIRPRKYFAEICEKIIKNNLADLLIAKYNNVAVAALIVTYYDGRGSYLYGASSNDYRNTMAPYLLHWQAILEAKKRGCREYDLLAVAPENRERETENGERLGNQKIENRKHKYDGITRFKEQFGGRKVHLVGSYDLIYKPSWYGLFKVAEKIRRK